MSKTLTTEEPTVARPETYRLPKPGRGDPYFGCSRSHYYEIDKRLRKRGKKFLIHIRDEGKSRGVTLIPYEKMAAIVREAQDWETK
jgi:hypothetical protein